MIKVIKKDGTIVDFNDDKIKKAISKSADRVCVKLTDKQKQKVCEYVRGCVTLDEVPVKVIHNLVETALDKVSPTVAKSYREYRDNKSAFADMLDKVYNKKLGLNFIGDRSNANADSAIITTQRSIVYNELNSELYKKFFLTNEEKSAMGDGYIYIHDRGSRLDSFNCFRRDTSFITDKGIKNFYDFNDGDQCYVITHKGRWKKATVHCYGYQPIQEVVIQRNHGKPHSIFVTKNHRWILKDGTETTCIKVGDRLIRTPDMSTIEWEGVDQPSAAADSSFDCNFYTNCEDGTWKVVDIKDAKLNPRSQVWCLEVEDDHSFLLEGGIPTGNCCLADMKTILTGGFEMGNLHYNEPKTLDCVMDLVGDVIMNMASCQYGGYTVSEIDKLLSPYAEKSYNKHYLEYLDSEFQTAKDLNEWPLTDSQERLFERKADEHSMKKVKEEFEQGWQGLEMKLNSVGSSRGDYPFTAITFGLGKNRFETLASSTCLSVRKKGQGKKGFEHPVLFPKLSFLYDEDLHGEGKELEWLFLEAIDCSSKAMYPDFISCTGDGYCGDVYRKYGKTVSRMGCRATLPLWFEKGGLEPLDESDYPVFEGRFNMGAISLHFPMILKKSQIEAEKSNQKVDRLFFKNLRYYCKMIRDIHKRTFNYFAKKKAGTNPLAFCQGGTYKGNFKPDDVIGREFLRPMSASFGITALNETQYLYNGKSLVEDSSFALKILQWMDKYKKQATKEDKILYALYGTPAESLCGLQVEQFRNKYGEQKGITDKPYTSNSFHCAVYEDITPIEKQDIEYPLYHYCTGGAIQYCRYPINYNTEAITTLVRRAMKMGFYEGVNLQLDYCEDCGAQFIDSDKCPKCGSENITRIERMNGYLGYSKVNGRTMYADHKLAEFKDRKSM